MFHSSKLLIPNVQLGIQFYFNPVELWSRTFAGAETFRLQAEDIKLKMYLCQVILNQEIYYLWTYDNVCEVLDSYALSLETYETTEPLQKWLNKQWKYVVENGKSLQSIYSQSSGDYALFFLIDRSQKKSMNEFLNRFDKHDYTHNDHVVGQMLKRVIEKQVGWNRKVEHDQCITRCCGVRDLLK